MFMYEHQAHNLVFRFSLYNFSITLILKFMCNFKRNLQLTFENANLVLKCTWTFEIELDYS